MRIDLKKIRHIHFIGIKGVAMAALAVWAKEKGFVVSGSDVEEVFPTDSLLEENKINWMPGFKEENLPDSVDLVVATGAHGGRTNILAQKARKKGIPVIMQGEALGLFMQDKKRIAVAGSHGKTTTTALIAHLLAKSGRDPSYMIGCGKINSLGSPGHAGKGDFFVAEADEYINCPLSDSTPKFLFIHQHIAVITNIEFDHPDAYPSIVEVKQAFEKFAQATTKNGFLVACKDNKGVREILPQVAIKKITYGKSDTVDYQLCNIQFKRGKTTFSLKHKEKIIGPLSIVIPGEHNVLNSIAASVVVSHLGISWSEIANNLASFTGTKRRFELIYQDDRVKVYDDYAHHPSEIKATLQAARQWFAKERIIVVFQPHTFSRTKALFDEFCQSFSQADVVIITDIYPSAREKFDPQISSLQLVSQMKKIHANVVYRPNKASVIDYLKSLIRKGDIVITMGAGDIYSWLEEIVEALS